MLWRRQSAAPRFCGWSGQLNTPKVAYAATVKVEGPQRTALVDARASDALNLAVLTDAPVFAARDVLTYCICRQAGDSAEATLMRRALTAHPMTIGRVDESEDACE